MPSSVSNAAGIGSTYSSRRVFFTAAVYCSFPPKIVGRPFSDSVGRRPCASEEMLRGSSAEAFVTALCGCLLDREAFIRAAPVPLDTSASRGNFSTGKKRTAWIINEIKPARTSHTDRLRRKKEKPLHALRNRGFSKLLRKLRITCRPLRPSYCCTSWPSLHQ